MSPADLNTVGWDIGGANVKVAFARSRKIHKVHQFYCPLWEGLHKLSECLNSVIAASDFKKSLHAVTMTGELVDFFDNRKQGVEAIVHEISEKLTSAQTRFYAGESGFLPPLNAIQEYKKIASSNWLASACYAARQYQNALFIDIGSTTTDIVCIQNHKAIYEGHSDEQRLIAKELIYCGVIRTPIFALCRHAQIHGRQVPVINEYFSNMADVYRITAELAHHADVGGALDGKGKDIFSSMRRLARMFANDASEDECEMWELVARQIRNIQLQMIKDACRHQLMKKAIPLRVPVIGAGIGRFLVKELAQALGRDYVDYETLFDTEVMRSGFNVADCAPASAVACLIAKD